MATAAATTATAAYDPKKIIGSLPQADDSVANQVTNLASKDSALNRMAATEGLKAVNRRGLLNSTMGIEASQDAVLKNILPIAQQDASQAFQKNLAAKQFEYGLAATEQAQGWQAGQADLNRDLEKLLQSNQISSAEGMQLKQIQSTEGMDAANRALQDKLQDKDIEFRMAEGKLTREAAEKAQATEIAFQTEQGGLNRALQEQIAKWNLSSTDRTAASQFVTQMETMYQSSVQSIMANTALDKKTRESYLTAAKNLRNTQLNLVEQMYNVDLKW